MALPHKFNDVNATSYQSYAWWNINVFPQMIFPDMFPSTEMDISENETAVPQITLPKTEKGTTNI